MKSFIAALSLALGLICVGLPILFFLTTKQSNNQTNNIPEPKHSYNEKFEPFHKPTKEEIATIKKFIPIGSVLTGYTLLGKDNEEIEFEAIFEYGKKKYMIIKRGGWYTTTVTIFEVEG